MGQLWFILWLFFISLILLPLVVWAARGKWRRGCSGSAGGCHIPLLVAGAHHLLVHRRSGTRTGWQAPVLYAFVFLLGFLVVCDPKFPESAERYRCPAFIGGIALTVFWVVSGDFRNSLPDPSWSRAGLAFLGSAALWLMVIGAMGIGKRYLNRTSAIERYLAEGSYPVYIIHQTMIVIIAFYVVDFAIPRAAQWVILLVLAVAATFALYEVVRQGHVLVPSWHAPARTGRGYRWKSW